MAISTQSTVDFGAPLKWIGFEDVPIVFVNHVLAQHQPNEFVLTFGQVTGAPVVSTHDQLHEQVLLDRVPIRTLARMGLTRERLVELIHILEATLQEHDSIVGPSS